MIIIQPSLIPNLGAWHGIKEKLYPSSPSVLFLDSFFSFLICWFASPPIFSSGTFLHSFLLAFFSWFPRSYTHPLALLNPSNRRLPRSISLSLSIRRCCFPHAPLRSRTLCSFASCLSIPCFPFLILHIPQLPTWFTLDRTSLHISVVLPCSPG